jgi:hypothetical protein
MCMCIYIYTVCIKRKSVNTYKCIYTRKLVNTYMYIYIYIYDYTPTYMQMNSYIYIICFKSNKNPHFAHTNISVWQDMILQHLRCDSSEYRNGYNQSNTQTNCAFDWLNPFPYYLNKTGSRIFKLRVRNLTKHKTQSPLPSGMTKFKIKKVIVLLFVLHEYSNLLHLLRYIDGVSFIAVVNTVPVTGCPGECRLSMR